MRKSNDCITINNPLSVFDCCLFQLMRLINNISSFIGSVEERQFCAGQKNGTALIRFVNGDTFEFNYSDGEMDGE